MDKKIGESPFGEKREFPLDTAIEGNAGPRGTAEEASHSRKAAPIALNAEHTHKVAVITGAGSGIGKAVALHLASNNYNIVLVSLETGALHEVEQELAKYRIKALVCQCDVTKIVEVQKTIQRSLETFGRIDVLVNSAGYAVYGPLETMPLDDICGQMLTNYFGTVLFTMACIPQLKASKGVIVNIASTAGLMGIPRLTAYSASKHAVLGFSESLKYELEETGVSVCVIAPGKVKTNIFTHPSFIGVRWAHDDSGISPDAVAREIAKAIKKRKFLYIVPRSRKLALFLKRVLPDSIVKRKMKDI
jgi:short-subunit dehydrogenase